MTIVILDLCVLGVVYLDSWTTFENPVVEVTVSEVDGNLIEIQDVTSWRVVDNGRVEMRDPELNVALN